MMVHFTSFITFVAGILINTISYCSAEKVYCVTPTATSCSSCPHNTPCATLSEYAQEAETYFTSATTMVFLAGDHVLDMNITVANVARLTMQGDKKATIFRKGAVGFSFTNMVDFNIYSLAFNSYNRSWSHGSRPAGNTALLLQSTTSANLVNCSFYNNLGTALIVHNTNITLTENEFTHNQCECDSFQCKLGCGITAHNSTLMFAGSTTFLKNRCNTIQAFSGAGAILAAASSLYFTGTNNFISNVASATLASGHTAGAGGAIHVTSNALLTLHGNNNFINNSAGFGGAIYTVSHENVTFKGTNRFIGNSAVYRRGGAIYAKSRISLTFIGTSNFSNNSARWGGGAISAETEVVLTFKGVNIFINNSAERFVGGAIRAVNNVVLHFNEINNFICNSAYSSGGAIHASSDTTFIFVGNSDFSNNSAYSSGGAIHAPSNTTFIFIGNSDFSNNSAYSSAGAIHASSDTTFIFVGKSDFSNNSAKQNGGAISTGTNVVLNFNGTNNFIDNSAKSNGGAISTFGNVVLNFNGTNNFNDNSAKSNGGAISTFGNVVLNFNGTNNFIDNSARSNGGAISTDFSVVLNFNGTNNFIDNSATSNGGAISAHHNVVPNFNGTNNFIGNSATNNGGAIFTEMNTSLGITGTSTFSRNSAVQGGAISANVNSTLIFDGNISFTNNGHDRSGLEFDNEETQGGAMYLDIHSTFITLPHTTVCWENNHATLGGAIYVSDVNPIIYCTQVATFIQNEECFFQLPGQWYEVKFIFKNNFAGDAGSVLYGGALENCKLTYGLDSRIAGDVFETLLHINDDLSTTSQISSDPLHIYPCIKNLPYCSGSQYLAFPNPVYPGETFQLSVVAVGQECGTVSSTVSSKVSSTLRSTVRTSTIDPTSILDYQYLQQAYNTCTKLNYTVFSLSKEVNITLYPEGSPCTKYNGGTLNYLVEIKQTCPPGFEMSKSERSCVCEPRLAHYTNQCNITNGIGQITRPSNKHFWVGYDNSSDGIILHPHCPFDYCVNDAKAFPLNNTDIQCAYNRSGLLCGRCKEGYSLVLGTHQCRKCTNGHLALLIPFALMGVALVLLLFICKLTVATGTLSGLVLYANIFGANRTIFLPVESTDTLSVFIAWLNLDFGIETCFYNGMDSYSKTWLQFVFPVYIWMLVGLMIFISHYSQRFTSLLGSNPVSVLATLILLSYTKVLRTFIFVSSFTYLDYPDNSTRSVWLLDANIDYFLGKHIPLFLMALLFLLFLFIPYTFLLIFGQWLQAISHLKLFSWVNSNRLKPFMDSYHAPHKSKHRYWPGLLLVLRLVFTLVFAFHDSSFNLLAIVVGSGLLQLLAWVSGGVYKNWCLDALEASFVLNLIVLGAATYYVDQTNGNKLAVGYTSVVIALVTFIAILAYHMFQQLRQTKLWKKVPKLRLGFKKLNNKQAEDNLNNPIKNLKKVDFDQLREPWLEDLLPPTHSPV